ncbi:MAG: hypothetical protein J5J00_15820 [Deltaproteobacteria bacterium]|nr:hypothetical protein [Deltaproteobacteria bacterium]
MPKQEQNRPDPFQALADVTLTPSEQSFVLAGLRLDGANSAPNLSQEQFGKGFFAGVRSQVIDNKSRLVLPPEWREAISEQGVTLVKRDIGSFFIMTTERFNDLMNGAEARKPDLHLLLSMISRGPLRIDGQGRITIGEDFLKIAGMSDRNVVMVGLRNSLMVWRGDCYEDFCHKRQSGGEFSI